MLKLIVPGREWFDESKEEFISSKDCALTLEHSLLSISKWESKWKVPFLEDKPPKTRDQSLDYIRCMTIGQAPDPFVYYNLTPDILKRINEYIGESQTATFINRRKKQRIPVKEPVTSELIYYWMITYGIPFECQKWHLSRLLMLIDVCVFKQETPTKMTPNEILKRNAALNKARCAKGHTRG